LGNTAFDNYFYSISNINN